jgi:hypothetical protein
MPDFMKINHQMKDLALRFADKKINSGTAFARHHETPEQQLYRWFRGKIGEQVVAELLTNLKIPFESDGMFEVVNSKEYRDRYDILLYPSLQMWKADVKSVSFDGKLLVHKDHIEPRMQWQVADLFIGYQLDLKTDDAIIFGYVFIEEFLEFNRDKQRQGPFYWFPKEKLHPMSDLCREGI